MTDLKSKCSLQENVASYIENTFSNAMFQIMNKLKGDAKQYTPELRAFALTLKFYSSKTQFCKE